MTCNQMINDQATMTRRYSCPIGHWCLVLGHLLATVAALTTSAAELVRLEGEPIQAELQTADSETLQFIAKSPLSLPYDHLVRWGHPRHPRAQIIVVLANGGRLTAAAAWSGGAPLRLDADKIIVLTDTWGEVPLPRSLVRGVVFAQRSHPSEREQLEEVVRRGSSPDPSLEASGNSEGDLVLLTNKDRVAGKLTALPGGSFTLETAAGQVKLPLSRVEALVFGREDSKGSTPVRTRQPTIVVGMRDGSLMHANRIESNENEFAIETAGGLRVAGGGIDDVVYLQSLGGRFVYLSDLEPDGYRHVPYLSIEWPYARDRSVRGEPLSVSGQRYLKGIGMHSASRLTYNLDGHYRRFDSAVAIDDSAGKRGSVTFGVYVLREGAWTEAFTSNVVRGGEAPRLVSVDVTGAQGLSLTVDYADRGDELDQADWLDARLVQ
jgi:NPCBM/NEW2 domain